MAKLLQLRRGTTSQHSSFAGALAEVTVDTDKQTLVVHNGNGNDGNGVAVASTANPTFTGTVTGPTINASTALQIGGVAVTSTAAELNILDGVTSTTAELNILDGVTSTAAELNILDGVTSTAAELNLLDGVTSTTAELNILDGVTSTAAELNILDGVTSTAAELNKLDGFTGDKDDLIYAKDLKATGVTDTEFDYLDGVTSAIQTQLDAKAPLAAPALTGTATAVNLTLSGDLTVNGTTTTINSTTLKVDDKNIELGTVDTPSDTTADGGGITLKGATDKTITWTDSTDSWDFNQDIKTSGTVTDSKGDVRSIPLRAVTSAAATLVLTDAGKVVSTDTTGWTVPALSWTAGDTVTLLNNSAGGLVITCSAVTTYLTSDGSTVTGPTLGARGMATLYFTASNTCYISGAGLS